MGVVSHPVSCTERARHRAGGGGDSNKGLRRDPYYCSRFIRASTGQAGQLTMRKRIQSLYDSQNMFNQRTIENNW